MNKIKAGKIAWLMILGLSNFPCTHICFGSAGLKRNQTIHSQGTWYPGDPASLKRMVDKYIADAKNPEIHGRIRALVVPPCRIPILRPGWREMPTVCSAG